MSSEFIKFPSRRSTVYSSKGIVASSQTLASAAGIEVLAKGGNAVDAAIAVSAALCVTEPGSTGVGGDCFVLFYKKGDKKVHGIDGCGRSARNVTIQDVLDADYGGRQAHRIKQTSIFSVTVPGAIAAWVDAFEKWGSGKVLLHDVLAPAIRLADEGFPVGEIASRLWRSSVPKLQLQNRDLLADQNPLLINGKGPNEGDFVQNKPLARLFTAVAKNGKDGFYKGPVAEAIVRRTTAKNHKLDAKDLELHESTVVDPISIVFENHKVWEIPPSGQGLVALLALGIIRELHTSGQINLHELEHNSPEYLHVLIEACKMGFYDSDEYVTDPTFHDIPLEHILDAPYLRSRAQLFSKETILDGSTMSHGVPDPKHRSDTVYLTTSDSDGNACSFINSVYHGFGSGIVVPEFGFALQSRGANFNLNRGTPNSLQGGKRPYHTIIPSMITTENDDLYASFGNMGGYMQPVGHVQHVLNMLLFNMTPQQLVDLPRFCLCSHEDVSTDRGRGSDGPVSTPITVVALEEGIDEKVGKSLEALGHTVQYVSDYDRHLFGRAQIIKNVATEGRVMYAAGSEMRADGAAMPLV
jgi:gamma-glutamyltranspeptidase/glutathione hydrolase